MEAVRSGGGPVGRQGGHGPAAVSDDDLLVRVRQPHPLPGLLMQLADGNGLHVTHGVTTGGGVKNRRRPHFFHRAFPDSVSERDVTVPLIAALDQGG